MPPPVPDQPRPMTGRAVTFSMPVAARIGAATKDFERRNRSGPRPPGGEPRGNTRPGAFAYLDSGDTISAAAGSTLGSGPATLCSRDGTALTADGEAVTVLNAGGEIVGPVYLSVAWADGDWATCVAPCS